MSVDSILSQIDAEIARLTQVRSLLASTTNIEIKVTGRKTKLAPATAKTRKKHVLSPEARKRIADAQALGRTEGQEQEGSVIGGLFSGHTADVKKISIGARQRTAHLSRLKSFPPLRLVVHDDRQRPR
jgi:hypothetical protein